MKRFRVMGVTLFALLVFGVLTAASASAAPTFLLAEWLVGGVPVTTELETTTDGELLLEDTAFKASVLCSVFLDGWVGPNSLDLISEVLTLKNTAPGTPLVGVGIPCVGQDTCPTDPIPEVWPINLPWETEVELMEIEGLIYFADFIAAKNGGNVGYELECTVLGVKSSDECSLALAVAELTLDAGVQLLGNFSEAFTELAGAKLEVCSFAGGETGIVEGGGIFALNGGGELTVSSDGVTV